MNHGPRLDLNRGDIAEEVRQALYDMETRLLRVFCEIAESTERNLLRIRCSQRELAEQLEALEERVMDIERRLNFPHFKP